MMQKTCFSRPRVPGAIAGTYLGEAAHRLIKNTLNIKSNNNGNVSSGWNEQHPHRNSPRNFGVNSRPRPVGPSGYERGYYVENNNHYHHVNYINSQGTSAGYRNSPPSNGSYQGGRNGDSARERQSPEQYREIRNGMSSLRVEDSVRINSRQSAKTSNTNSGQVVINQEEQFVRSMLPLPTPPKKWINRESTESGNGSSGGAVKIHQVKTRVSSQDGLSSDNLPL